MTGAGSTNAIERRTLASLAGHQGDVEGARRYLADDAPQVRSAALAALVRLAAVTPGDVESALKDPDADVRRAACEHGARLPGANFLPLLDDEAKVVEAAAYALGEIAEAEAVPALIEIASSHADPLCRESAVAALGAIGEERGLACVLAALGDLPAIRRRAVIALAAFEGEEVNAALRERLSDRDWQVRQAAEELLGVSEDR